MRKGLKNSWLVVLVFLLFISVGYLFYLDLKGSKHGGLTFAMLDIGQGDGLLVESPTGTKLMFDAGPPGKVLAPLSKILSPFDKKIDALVITNPDADHISGFLDILKNYEVDQVFEPGTFNNSKTYQNLEAAIKAKNIPDILARQGMRLDIGGGAVIDILFPDRDVSNWTANDGSIVAKLSYGKTSVMLTGDATTKTEGILLSEYSQADLKSDVLKVGHHGSRTSSSPGFVEALAPSYAMISDGQDNKYGHPHQETLDTLLENSVKIFRTDLLGTIIMHSDGQNISFSFEH